MTLFIRDKENKTIVDCEIWNKKEGDYIYTDISTSIDIETYSKLLLNTTGRLIKLDIIETFWYSQELREWLWHGYYSSGSNNGEDLDDIKNEVKKFFTEVCNRFDLEYVED